MNAFRNYVFLLFALCLSTAGVAQDYSPLDTYLDAMVVQKKFIGSILVAQGDSIVYQKGCGPAVLDGSKTNSSESQFLIGSITKTFTAVAILQLFEQGKLALSDPLSKYIPLFPTADEISIRHLLTHRSGIKNYTELPDLAQWKAEEFKPLRIIEKVMDYPLAFEPGSMYSYSNSNYILLGIIIEQISGSAYAKHIKTAILKPAGLSQTGMNYAKAKFLSQGLVKSNTGWAKADEIDASIPFSAGALYSTTSDLFTFSKAFFRGEFFDNKSTYTLMTNFDEGFYGMGVYVEEIDKQVYIGHNGAIDGYSASWSYFTELGLHVIILANSMESNNDEVLDAILHAVLGKEISIPEPKQVVELSQTKLEKFVGTYQIQQGFDLNIFILEGQLIGQATGQGALELFAENDSAFFAAVGGIEILFHQKGNSDAEALTLFQGGGQTRAPRIAETRLAIQLNLADLATLTGTYMLQEGFELQIFREDSKLYGQATGQPSFELFAESRKDFFTKGIGIEISFDFDGNGETKSLTLFQGGEKYEAEKKQP